MISFGGVDLDPVELGINGNAILGIKESGKSYLGTELGEIFFDNDIPFVAFDPIGIWHNMRYPGRGKGYPIVVAGGFHGDIPLTAATAPAIVEAAMRNRVSLVLDLFHPELSKADWRTIVRDCAFLLLHKNHQYGLRHVFIEEAAEFVPQKVFDGRVYDAVERLIRMGGNSRLGCTLITPRSQEVNKAVLELCENLFLFRQRGKNALENLKKWLEIAGNDAKNIISTLPNLEKGQCWAWLGGRETPILIQVPQKSSFHPDRRQMGADAAESRPKPVSASKFVKTLTAELPKVEEEAKANDPKHLRAEIKRLEGVLAGRGKIVAVDPALEREKDAEIARLRAVEGQLVESARRFRENVESVFSKIRVLADMERLFDAPELSADVVKGRGEDQPSPVREAVTANPRRRDPAGLLPNVLPDPGMTPAKQKILDKIAWAEVFFFSTAVERQILAFLVNKHPRTKGFINDLGALRTSGLIDYLDGQRVTLTDAGRQQADRPPTANKGELVAAIKSVLTPRQGEILDMVLPHGPLAPPDGYVERAGIAASLGLHERTKSLLNDLGRLRTLGLIIYRGAHVRAADYLMDR